MNSINNPAGPLLPGHDTFLASRGTHRQGQPVQPGCAWGHTALLLLLTLLTPAVLPGIGFAQQQRVPQSPKDVPDLERPPAPVPLNGVPQAPPANDSVVSEPEPATIPQAAAQQPTASAAGNRPEVPPGETDGEQPDDTPDAKPTATEEDLALRAAIADSRQIYHEKIAPLQQEISISTQLIHVQLNSNRQMLSLLKSRNDQMLPILERQLEQLIVEIELYTKAVEALTENDSEETADVIDAVTANIASLQKKQQSIQQPLSQRMAEIYNRHAPDNENFANQFKRFFLEKGTGEFAGFTRKPLTGNLGAAQVSAQYRNQGNTITISLQGQRVPNYTRKNRKLLAGKYPIISESDRNIYFVVNDLAFSAYTSPKAIPTETFHAFLANVMRLDELHQALKTTEPATPVPAP